MTKAAKRIAVTAVTVLAIIVLTVITVVRTSSETKNNSINHMNSIAEEQAIMIRDYVKNAEKMLEAYSCANEVEELLLDPTNAEKTAAAQKYTEKFSGSVDGIEGIYTAEWNTHILAHTHPKTVGITTRKDPNSLKELQNAVMNSPDNLCNTGIIISPSSGEQIVSVYKAMIRDGDPIGLVGLGIYTDELVKALNNMRLNTSGSSFSMINVTDRTYIFCNDRDNVGREVSDSRIVKACVDSAGKAGNITGHFEGRDTITFYSYISENDWLLLIESPSDEIFGFSRSINLNIFFSVSFVSFLSLSLTLSA